jgi:hypothetical protein
MALSLPKENPSSSVVSAGPRPAQRATPSRKTRRHARAPVVVDSSTAAGDNRIREGAQASGCVGGITRTIALKQTGNRRERCLGLAATTA